MLLFYNFHQKIITQNDRETFPFLSSPSESIKGNPRQQEAAEGARNNPGARQLHEQRDEGQRLRLQAAELEQNNRHQVFRRQVDD